MEREKKSTNWADVRPLWCWPLVLPLSTAAPVLAADADEVQTPAAQTEQQETDTEADEADVDTEADEAAALPELSEDREVAEEDEAVALPELSEDREVAEGTRPLQTRLPC